MAKVTLSIMPTSNAIFSGGQIGLDVVSGKVFNSDHGNIPKSKIIGTAVFSVSDTQIAKGATVTVDLLPKHDEVISLPVSDVSQGVHPPFPEHDVRQPPLALEYREAGKYHNHPNITESEEVVELTPQEISLICSCIKTSISRNDMVSPAKEILLEVIEKLS